jgi:putative membrane protein
MSSHKLATGFAVIMLSVSGYAMAAQAATSHMTKEFIEDASAAGMFEVDTSKVALDKSSNDKIKDFAQKMVDDHTKAGDELKSTVSDDQKQYLSTKETMMQSIKLKSLKNDKKDFDEDYVEAQVKAHDDAVKLFTKYSEKGDDANLKAFAAKTLPTLQEHQKMINDIHTSMK